MVHAPNTINGYFCVTEQGEMIHQNSGYSDVAECTMDIYTAVVLAENVTVRLNVLQAWKDLLDDFPDISCDAYWEIVQADERFVPYFREATSDFTGLNIG
jgi:phosphoenolpyruvate carboxylase